MTRGTQAFAVAGGGTGGLLVGLFGGRAVTKGMAATKRANVVLLTSVLGAALGAGVTAYYTAPKLQLTQ